mmetsp:Transcript_1791/g.4527  ORF Transcript_1791/g.4527 Transcript_1791/m.4527 type:complete len:304 (+) Transcript_1791:84-995(+)
MAARGQDNGASEKLLGASKSDFRALKWLQTFFVPLAKEAVWTLYAHIPRPLSWVFPQLGALRYLDETSGELRKVNTLDDLPPKAAPAVRVVCVSDTHLRHRQLVLPAGDILLHAGDILFKNRGAGEQASRQLADFNDWMESQPFTSKLCIGGNHDRVLVELGATEVQGRLSACKYLVDETVSTHGLRIHGSPVSEGHSKNSAFQAQGGYDEDGALAKIPTGLDILLTHGPAGVGMWGRGSPKLDECVRRVKPRFHVYGHVHVTYGACKVDGLVSVNASSPDGLYHLTHPPVVMDIVPQGVRHS